MFLTKCEMLGIWFVAVSGIVLDRWRGPKALGPNLCKLAKWLMECGLAADVDVDVVAVDAVVDNVDVDSNCSIASAGCGCNKIC